MTNLLPLETWRNYFGYHPFHFWQQSNNKTPVTSACNSLVYEHQWQGNNDSVGREEILQAIETAETRLQEYLGYAVAPHYIIKTIPFPKYDTVGVWRRGGSIGADGLMIPVLTGEGYVQALGIESYATLGNAAVAITDDDGDTVNETFRCSIATTETDPTKVGLYFTTADRLDGAALGADNRIQPVSVTIAAGTASFIGRSYLLIKPLLYEGVINQTGTGIDPNDATKFVSQLTVAVRSTDGTGQTVDTAQATLLWETVPCTGWWGCCSSYSPPIYNTNMYDPAAVGMAVARAGIRNGKLGEVLPAQAVYDTTALQWRSVNWAGFREPDQVTLRYLAGWPLGADGNMDRKWQVIVARLAAAELARPICACDVANQELFHWQFDVSRSAGANDEQYSISPADLDNPLGTRRGQVWAWKQIRNLRFAGGSRVG